MSRQRGTFETSINQEPTIEAPLDAREVVSLYDDLFLPATWRDQNGNPWLYNGLLVSIATDPLESNNGIWQLRDKDNYTLAGSWVKISGGGGGGTDDQTAAEVSYSNTASGLSATNVQDAVDELNIDIGSIENDKYKSGRLLNTDFSSTGPNDTYKATITFNTAFVDTNYSLSFVGNEPYLFSYGSKTISSVVVDLNTAQTPIGEILWVATPYLNI
jgi:hypothetical protein